MARVLPFSSEAILEAAALIRAGRPVAVPTETVYGLAADATDGAAVARVYQAKGRPAFNPLIVHVADLAEAERHVVLPPALLTLAERHWPGPLTIVAQAREGSPVAGLVRAGLSTLAVRVPAHRAMRAVIEAAGRPLAAPSANRSGAISPTCAQHVARSLDDAVDLILDDGPCPLGLESTIVKAADGGVAVLRPGPIDLGPLTAPTGVEAPGQLAQHYAPAASVRLGATAARPGEWLIGFGAVAGDDTLSAAGDLTEAAARLFDALHRADATGRPIAVAPVPDVGLGVAINDRLRRAAAGKEAP